MNGETKDIQFVHLGGDIMFVSPFTETETEFKAYGIIFPKNAMEGYEVKSATVPVDFDYSLYRYNGASLVPKRPVDSAVAAKIAEINVAWDAADNSTFTYASKQFNADQQAKNSINSVATAVLLTGLFPPGFPNAWKCADNTFIPMNTPEQFKEFYNAMCVQGINNFTKAQQLKQAATAATTPAELAAIHW